MAESRHRHRCFECHTVWEHADSCADLSYRVRVVAHCCPRCSQVEQWRYDGPESAEFHDHHLPLFDLGEVFSGGGAGV